MQYVNRNLATNDIYKGVKVWYYNVDSFVNGELTNTVSIITPRVGIVRPNSENKTRKKFYHPTKHHLAEFKNNRILISKIYDFWYNHNLKCFDNEKECKSTFRLDIHSAILRQQTSRDNAVKSYDETIRNLHQINDKY